MKRIFGVFALVCLLACSSFGSPIPLTGTISLPDGSKMTGTIRLTLSVSGARDTTNNNVIVPMSVQFRVQQGSLQSSAQVVPNDVLQPGNTWYTAEYFTAAGSRVAVSHFYISGQSFDLGSATPTPVTTSNLSFGNFTNLTDVSTGKLNNAQTCIRSGANAGVKIAAAIAALPSTGGIADCRDLQGTQTISSNIFSGVTKPVTLLLGDATFSVSTEQSLAATNNWQIIGTGGGGDAGACRGTTLTWTGTSGGTVLTLDRVRDSLVEGLCIQPSANIGIGIKIDHVSAPSGSTNSTHDVFHRISIGASTAGIQIGNSSTGNNAEHEFDDVYITGVGTYGIYVNNSQSKNIRITRGAIGNRTNGIYQLNGSLKITQVVFNANTADINLRDANDTILIEGNYSEGSGKFLDTGGPSGNAFNVSLINNQIQPNGVGADNILIRYRFLGPFVMTGNNFGGSTNPSIKVDVGTSNATTFYSSGNTYVNCTPFSSTGGSNAYWSISDNCIDTADAPKKLTNTITATPTFSNGMTVTTSPLTAGTLSVGNDDPQSHLLSGTYTPTITNVANIASSALSGTPSYMQVGKEVIVSGILTIQATATGNVTTEVDLSVPVLNSSNIDGMGGAMVSGSIGVVGINGFQVQFGNTNKIRFIASQVTNLTSLNYSFILSYHLQFLAPLFLPRGRRKKRGYRRFKISSFLRLAHPIPKTR